MARMIATVVALSAVVVGCCDSKEPTDAIPASPEPAATPPAAVATPPQPPVAPTVAVAPPPGGLANDGLPHEIPSTRSTVPTIAEWNAVPREVTVAGSSALNCETRMVREWLRVSCRGKTNTGGEPRTVVTRVGGGPDTYLFAKNGVTSVVTPVKRSKRYEALFTWTNTNKVLVIDWPHGAPRPVLRFQ